MSIASISTCFERLVSEAPQFHANALDRALRIFKNGHYDLSVHILEQERVMVFDNLWGQRLQSLIVDLWILIEEKS